MGGAAQNRLGGGGGGGAAIPSNTPPPPPPPDPPLTYYMIYGYTDKYFKYHLLHRHLYDGGYNSWEQRSGHQPPYQCPFQQHRTLSVSEANIQLLIWRGAMKQDNNNTMYLTFSSEFQLNISLTGLPSSSNLGYFFSSSLNGCSTNTM